MNRMLLALVASVACVPYMASGKVPLDKDGEAMWGHVYMEDGATSFEFFRATFGGPYNCDAEGQQVFMAPIVGDDAAPEAAAERQEKAQADADEKASSEGIAEVTLRTLGTGCDFSEVDVNDVRGKVALVSRGVCSFNDKAIVAEKHGAAGLIVVNKAPGLLRMPGGVLKQKHGFDVTIPVVMISDKEGKLLRRFLERDPLQKVRIIGENNVKGKLLRQGRCATIANRADGQGVEVNADGSINSDNVNVDARTISVAEGGEVYIHLNGLDEPVQDARAYEFLRGMFGGPLPRSPLEVVVASPIDGCAPIENAIELRNKIALVERGSCMFTNKGQNVEAAGAAGMIVVNRDSKDLTRMWAGEKAIREITIPSVMVTGKAGDAILANMPRPVLLKSTRVTNTDWQQVGRFARLSDWPEDDDERLDLYNKLGEIHNPDTSEKGHWERWEVISTSFQKAEDYYDSISSDV